jgi:hypothetical protein
MKTKEAPEKIYITYKGYGVFDEDSTVERTKDSQTEYTRTDAFIEMAKEWFINHVDMPQEVETNEDGEPLADSYIKYAKSRLNAANEIFEDFIKYVNGK